MKILFNQEEAVGAYGNERENKGKEEQAKKTARNLANAGMTPEQIASAVDYSIDQVKEWITPQMA